MRSLGIVDRVRGEAAREEPSLARPPGPGSASPLDDAFRQHAGEVATTALRILGRREEADDVVQEVFLAAMRGLSRLREPKARQAWLLTVTVRAARRRLRRRRLRSFIGLDEVPEYEELADPGAPPEVRVLLGRIYAALDTVPPRERLAWALHHVEGEPLPTVALLCECSLATVKRRIAAASKVIQKAIDHG